jgi:hypothetical protein
MQTTANIIEDVGENEHIHTVSENGSSSKNLK